MLLPVLTFGVVIAIVVGVYWAFVVTPEQQSGDQLRRRLQGLNPAPKKNAALLKPVDRLSTIDLLEFVFSRATRAIRPIHRTILQSGLRVTVGTIVLASGCAGLLAYLLLLWITKFLFIAVVSGAIASMAPITYVRWVRNKRMIKFEEQFPEAIDLLGRALRAGHALTTGLAMVAEELPDPIGTEFRLLFDQQNYGLPLPDALKSFAERVPSLDARFFVTAVLTQRESGGNLSEVLDNLAAIIRDRFRVKRQVRVISAHGRITGWVLACLPPALAMMFVILTPDSYRRFYTDPLGIRMIAGALFLQFLGVLLIRKIVRIEY